MFIPRDNGDSDNGTCGPLSSTSAICAFEISLCFVAVISVILLLFGLPLYFRVRKRGKPEVNSVTTQSHFTAIPARLFRRREAQQEVRSVASAPSQDIEKPLADRWDPFSDPFVAVKKGALSSSSIAPCEPPASLPGIRARDSYPVTSLPGADGSLRANEAVDFHLLVTPGVAKVNHDV